MNKIGILESFNGILKSEEKVDGLEMLKRF
jgi:hypothetical protein